MSEFCKILVIEDSQADFLLLTRYLTQQGCSAELTRVASNEELERALDRNDWSLILFDYNVPGLDFGEGFALACERAPALPVILLSGSVGEEKAVELLKMGVRDFVLKDNLIRLPSAIERSLKEAADQRSCQAAQAALQESEQRFRTIFTESRDALLIFCPQHGRFGAVNPAALRMFRSPGERGFTELTLCDLSPEVQPDGRASKEKAEKLVEYVLATGGSQFDWRHRRLDGEEFAAEVLLSRISLQGETVIQATIRDVSLQKKTMAALLESEQFNRQIIANAQEGIIVYGPDLRYQVWNRYMENLTGFTAQEVIGRHPLELFGFLKGAGILAGVEKLLAGQPVDPVEFPFQIPSKGISGWAQDISSPLRNTAGVIVGVIAVVRDITASKQGEATLRKLYTAVEQNPAVVVITDTDGIIEYVNPAFCSGTGYSPDEAIGQSPRILKGDTPVEVHQRMWQTVSSGGTWDGEFHNRKKDGSFYWEHAIIAPVKDQAGAITNYLAITEDVTERRNLEEQFRQAQKMEALGQLAGGMAHDFNNIMQVIMGNAQLQVMTNEKLGLDCHFQEQIFEAIEHGSSLTKNLLVFSRRHPLERSGFNLSQLALDTVKLASRLLTEDIVLHVDVVSDCLMVNGDRALVQQMIFNLITNARDAIGKNGRITLRVTGGTLGYEASQRFGAKGVVGECAVLSLTDNGCGIGDEIKDRIFEPFFTTKTVGKGTGLGLAMIYSMVSQMNGCITVESAPGVGTAFHIYLPLLEAKGSTGAQAEATSGELRGTGELILVAEDDPAVRSSTVTVLTSFGYRVLAAESGNEAIRLLSGHAELPRLLILDVIMPGLHGPETYNELQQLHGSIPVLFLSGYNDDLLESKGHTMDHLQKPVHPLRLLGCVRRILGGYPP